MASFIGKMDSYDEATEPWPCYQERLDQYFLVNEIANDKKVPALLSLVGSQTYRLLRDLFSPDLPSTKDYAVLCDKLKDHYAPKPLVIAERFRFYKRDQKSDESVRDFNVALKKLSEYCDFGDNLKDALRDRFVCGLKSEAIQKKLLSERDLTYDKALEIAQAMESAYRDVVQLQGKSLAEGASADINKLKLKSVGKKGKKKWEKSAGTQQPAKSPGASSNVKKPCYRCLRTNHTPENCRFKNATCHGCRKKGHILPACKAKTEHSKEKMHTLNVESSDEEYLKTLSDSKDRNVIWVSPEINGTVIDMELDTGSGISVISKQDFDQFFKNCELINTSLTLKTYSGEPIHPLGYLECNVQLNDQSETLNLYVLNNEGRPLFGREWLRHLNLNWAEIKSLQVPNEKISRQSEIDNLKSKYAEVFSDGLGKLKTMQAKLILKDNSPPKFVKARPVPYSLKAKIDTELDKLVDEGVIEKVDTSEWATPIVPVPKENGDIRICGDYKVTVNPILQVEQYPLPRIDDLFASLSGGQHFSKIDLKNAYLQIVMEEESKKLLTINTHRGLFRYNRLVFGIASAPAIFQKTIEQVMQGVPGTQVILDDMIITGRTDMEHIRNLELALQKLSENGLKANPEKCEFFKDRVTFCGHVIDKEGLHKTQDKIDAILNAPEIENVSQLRSFLGLVTYYSKFIPDMSTVLQPLHQLLEKDRKWKWTKECQVAVSKIKEIITSDMVLTHYDPDLPVTLACDASSYGLGCVLSHIMPNGQEKPIAFASRTLNKAERKYSQIDKEALSIVWAVKKNNLYLYGKEFTLITDHKPLMTIFSPKKGISSTTAARLQRYALFLAGYTYDIKYKNTKSHGNCDSLSRLPQKTSVDSYRIDATEIFYMSHFESLPVTVDEIRRATDHDPVLSRVKDSIRRGWSYNTDNMLDSYFSRRDELSLHQGCIIWGMRVVVPLKLRQRILDELHEGHLGMVKVKSLARNYVWWPKIDQEIEKLIKRCAGCQQNRNIPPEAPIHPWEYPDKPWKRIHVDFAGPFLDSMFLIIVDSYSKWPVVKQMRKTTATQTIEVMRAVFSEYGIPAQIVSDNGPQFIAEEFKTFLRENGIQQILSAPYHPKTNGLAERFVQSFKVAMKAAKNDCGTIPTKLSKFLMAYRNTPHSTTNECPATLFLGRKLTTRLDLLKPNLSETVSKSQQKMVRSTRDRQYEVGDSVSVRDYRGNHDAWIPGTIHRKTGPVSYEVEIGHDTLWRRHSDQIQSSGFRQGETSLDIPVSGGALPSTEPPPLHLEPETCSPAKVVKTPVKERRYPVRSRKKPEKLDL